MAAYRQLGNKYWVRDDDYAGKIDDDESRSAVLARLKRETPEIAEADRRTDRSHQECIS